MEQLTGFERALLGQFESLARSCEASLHECAATASALETLSTASGKRIEALEKGQSGLVERLDALTTALATQTQHTRALVDAVNRLMAAQRG